MYAHTPRQTSFLNFYFALFAPSLAFIAVKSSSVITNMSRSMMCAIQTTIRFKQPKALPLPPHAAA